MMHLFTTENTKQLLKFKMHPKNQREADKCVDCMYGLCAIIDQ